MNMPTSRVLPTAAILPAMPHPTFARNGPSIGSTLAIHGRYSVERLLALEEYSRATSYWHLLWVVFWVPLVPLSMIILYQLPHLAPPQAGLQANWMYVIERGGFGLAVATECCMVVTRTMMPELIPALTLRTTLLLGIFVAGLYIVMLLGLASGLGFPLPFTPSVITPTVSFISTMVFYLIIRPIVKRSSDLQRRVRMCFTYIGVFSVGGIAYPAYISLFFAMGEHYPHYQPVVTLLVPLLTLVLRKIMARETQDWEDLIPVQLGFTIEFFSSVYQTISLQASNSAATTVAIISLDLALTASGQWKLYQHTKGLQFLLHTSGPDALLPLVATICDDAKTLKTVSADELGRLRTIQLYSCAGSSQVSVSVQRRLENIDDAKVFLSSTRSSEVQKLRAQSTRDIHGLASSIKQAPTTSALSQGIQGTVVLEASAMLFRTEMMLLAEYRECLVPCFYGINLAIMWLSSNFQYYTHAGTIKTSDQLLRVELSIFVLFALETVSFVVLTAVLWKRLRFSPLHQLGFVLENEATIIRANILFGLILTLAFNLVHAGVDFSFQFKWLQPAA